MGYPLSLGSILCWLCGPGQVTFTVLARLGTVQGDKHAAPQNGCENPLADQTGLKVSWTEIPCQGIVITLPAARAKGAEVPTLL